MINNDKIGQFIKKLRKDNKMSQDDLAEKLYLTRQAISSWETGKTIPNVDNIKDLANIFNVSMPEIYQGEIINNKQTINDIFHSILKLEIKRYKKYTILSLILFILVFVSFTIYYFITYYNNISVYSITVNTNDYKVYGIINRSVNNFYFNLQLDHPVDELCLIHDNQNILCEVNSNFIVFTEKAGYGELISIKDKNRFENIIFNLDIKVTNNNETKYYKLDVEKDYQNNNLFASDDERMEISTNEEYELKFPDVPEKIRNEFKYDENENKFYLEYKEKDLEIFETFFVKSNEYIVQEKKGNIQKDWNYQYNNRILSNYSVSDNKNKKVISIIDDFSNMKDNLDKKNVYDYFVEKYLNKYI